MRLILLFTLLVCPLISFAQNCDDVPEHNLQIVKLAKSKMRKRVGRGECWDLAQYVLDKTESKWDGLYKYGRRINRQRECIMPGDIIQFERVKVRYQNGRYTVTESMAHHTAIVYDVSNQNEIRLIHQNTAETGRRVGISSLNFEHVISGRMKIYRPVR